MLEVAPAARPEHRTGRLAALRGGLEERLDRALVDPAARAIDPDPREVSRGGEGHEQRPTLDVRQAAPAVDEALDARLDDVAARESSSAGYAVPRLASSLAFFLAWRSLIESWGFFFSLGARSPLVIDSSFWTRPERAGVGWAARERSRDGGVKGPAGRLG